MSKETAMELALTERPPHRCGSGHEHYNLGWIGVQWCVTYALELLAEDPSRGQRITTDITHLDGAMGFPRDPNRNTIGLFHVNPEHAATVDLATAAPPLLVQVVSAKDVDYGHQMIDGWHRCYRARSQGLTELEVIVLSAEVEQAVRVVDLGNLLRRV